MAKIKVLKNGKEIKAIEFKASEEIIGGRGDTCQLVLDDDSISRHHFKIFKDNRGWVLEKLSKFGALYRGEELVSTHVLDGHDIFTVPPFVFQFEDYEPQPVVEPASQAEPVPAVGDTSRAVPVSDEKHATGIDADFNFDEHTSVEGSRAVPFLTVYKSNDEVETLRLEGVAWLAGRDESCEIILDDQRSSRRHFKLYKDQGDYFVQDLGSSNGTLLNGDRLGETPIRLESGDRIQIGETELCFEVKDPTFDDQISRLPAELNTNTTTQNQSPPVVFIPINMDASKPAGSGAMRIDGGMDANGEGLEMAAAVDKNAKAKKIRFAAIVMIVLALVGYLFMDNEPKKDLASKDPKASKNPFDSLTPQEQEFVRRTYDLSKNLYMQLKYDLALAEIRKIHEKIPAYLDSKTIETQLEGAIQTVANKKFLEEQERKEREARENAKRVVESCIQKFSKSSDVAAIEACLAPSMEIDPENPQAKALIEKAKALIAQKELEKTNRAEWVARAKKREALFKRAKKYQEKGKLVDALETYQRHIASVLPDPKNLEAESKRSVDSIKGEINTVLSSAVQEAENHVANAEYKEAILKLDRALEFDPNNKKARTLYEQASKELFKKMKSLFSDAVVEEGLGNIDSAKSKWKKILDLDVPKGEYRAKAEIKLKKYGE